MFRRILYNVIHTYLPEIPQIVYSLCTKAHNKSLIGKTIVTWMNVTLLSLVRMSGACIKIVIDYSSASAVHIGLYLGMFACIHVCIVSYNCNHLRLSIWLNKETWWWWGGGARRRGRPRTAWVDNIKTWTGLPVEESVRMTEDRDKWKKSVHGVANLRIEDS